MRRAGWEGEDRNHSWSGKNHSSYLTKNLLTQLSSEDQFWPFPSAQPHSWVHRALSAYTDSTWDSLWQVHSAIQTWLGAQWKESELSKSGVTWNTTQPEARLAAASMCPDERLPMGTEMHCTHSQKVGNRAGFHYLPNPVLKGSELQQSHG